MMKTKVKYGMMDAVYKAKLFIEGLYFKGNELRWSYCKPIDSYNDDRNRVELYVLQGMPPRGFIIANYAARMVKAWDQDMKRRITTCITDFPCKR